MSFIRELGIEIPASITAVPFIRSLAITSRMELVMMI